MFAVGGGTAAAIQKALADYGEAAATMLSTTGIEHAESPCRLWHDGPMNHITAHTVAPQEWVDALARSKAQIAAGQTVPLAPVLLRLRDSAARMEAGPAPRPYPSLAALGFLWIKAGARWIAYHDAGVGPVIGGIFYERADIPNRIP